MNLTYPIAMDSNYGVWEAFHNEYWPAFYFIDGKGRIRHHAFGEGEYDRSERVMQSLLKENGAAGVDGSAASISAQGVEAGPDFDDERSPETYMGYREAAHFSSPERVDRDSRKTYSFPGGLSLNQWALAGSWNVGAESGVLVSGPGKVTFRFHSRDLHFVLGPAKNGMPVRFKVTLDGAAPGADCGSDSSAEGTGEVREYRLYQLVRQKRAVEDRTFTIEFLDAGVQAFVFTFG